MARTKRREILRQRPVGAAKLGIDRAHRRARFRYGNTFAENEADPAGKSARARIKRTCRYNATDLWIIAR